MGIKCPKCHSDNPNTQRFCGECGTQIIPKEEIPVTKTLETPTDKLTRGTTFADRYEIIEELGKGGMGNVYRVEDTKIKEEVALKLIKPEIAADKKTINRFRNELKFARKIRHKNVCQMFDLGEEKGTHYITMEYIPGEDLKSMIKMSGQIAVGKTIKIAKQVAEGLNEAHQLGIVHRDLKPNNVMIDKEGNAHIMDFGIARSLETEGVTEAGVMIGTPEYMSPEQVEGEEVDQRSDIYSLGVMLYEMLTGQVPFAGKTPISVAMKQKSETPKNPREINAQIPEGLSLMILRCMEKEKERRYQNEEEILSELNRIEKEIPTRERVIERRKPSFQSFLNTLKERKMLETLAAFIGGGVIILEIVHWILIDHYHFPEESLDITIVTLICALICTLIWRFFKGVERKARKIKAELIMISVVILATVFFDALLILKIERPVSEQVSERFFPTHKQLTFTGKARYPAISPDGNFIAYVDSKSVDEESVMVQDMVSGNTIEVFSAERCENLRWTRDSSEISFYSRRDEESSTIIVPRLGGSPRAMGGFYYISWSPDDSQLAGAWVTSQDIKLYNKATGDVKNIPLNVPSTWFWDIDWSPSGGLILFLTGSKDETLNTIWTVTTDGSKQRKILEVSYPLYSPRWSPRGDAIFYLKRKEQTTELWKIKVSPDTGEALKPPSLVLAGLQTGEYFTVTSNGRKLLYTREITYSNLWVATVGAIGRDQTIKTKQLTKGTMADQSPSISPDGRSVAFSRGDSKTSNIYIMPLEGGLPQQVTFLDSMNTEPVWSPDGEEIAFYSTEEGNDKVWRVSVDGGKLHQFKESSVGGNLAWSPGEKILYQAPGNRNIHVLDPASGKEAPLTEEVGYIFSPKYSPDGKRVAVMWNRRPSRGIWVISREDSSQVFLKEGTDWPAGWSTDGKWIYVQERVPGTLKIIMVSSDGSQVKTLISLPFTSEMGRPVVGVISMTPDGKQLVIPVYYTNSDVWMVENFDPDAKKRLAGLKSQ